MSRGIYWGWSSSVVRHHRALTEMAAKVLVVLSIAAVVFCEPPAYPPAGSSGAELPSARVALNLFRSSRRPESRSEFSQERREHGHEQAQSRYAPDGSTASSRYGPPPLEAPRSSPSADSLNPGHKYGPPSLPSDPSIFADLRNLHSTTDSRDNSLQGGNFRAPDSRYIPTDYTSRQSVPSFSSYSGQTSADYRRPDAGFRLSQPNSVYGTPDRKSYEQEMTESPNYDFLYDVNARDGNEFGHEEAREGEIAHGRYHVLLPDGRMQVVEYTADEDGFKPRISFKEPNSGYPSSNSGPY